MSSFPTTKWSRIALVSELAQSNQPVEQRIRDQAREALDQLCQAYWFPAYAYARGLGNGHQDAEDLTQLLFQSILDGDLFARADPNKGRFRNLLLTQFKFVISNHRRTERTAKRGGHVVHVPLDPISADEEYRELASGTDDPSVMYDRAWAREVVDSALRALEAEERRKEGAVPFELLRGHLPGGMACRKYSYAEIVERYPGVTTGALMTHVSRLNKRFRELLHATVADTVDPADVEQELRHLVQALAHG
jgi:DNA-directed RNA polymerase specialized sigma24 family protein